MMSELRNLPNVGKVLESRLNDIGVRTVEELNELGAEKVFVRIKEIDSSACLQMLYGIQGAIENKKDAELSKETKESLRIFYREGF